MSTYSLESVFNPRSVAVVGGSPRARSLGAAVLRNLQAAGFAGPLGLVNPSHARIDVHAAPPRPASRRSARLVTKASAWEWISVR